MTPAQLPVWPGRFFDSDFITINRCAVEKLPCYPDKKSLLKVISSDA